MFSGGAYSDGPYSVPSQAILSGASTESDVAIAALVPAPTVSLHAQDGTAIGVASTTGMFSGGAFSDYDEYTVFGTGPTSQASIAALVPGPTSQVSATCGNEDVDIDATVPAPTVQMAVTNDVLGNKLATIASVVPAPVSRIVGEAKTGQILGGSSLTDIFNFARNHIHEPRKDDEDDEPTEVEEEQEPEQPLFTLPDPPPPPTAAEIAMQHAMAAHQLRMKQQAILHLLSQV